MRKKKFAESFGSGGYYIALILCAVAIGISGYLYYRNANPKTEKETQVISTNPTGDVEAVATDPQQGDEGQQGEPTGPAATEPAQKPSVIRKPLEGQTLAPYAMDALSYNQTTRDWRTHNGVDIAAKAGAEVCAAASGTVYTVYEDETMGSTVVIRHEGGYVTTYSSLAADLKVAAGDLVSAGQVIGTVGNTALLENAIGDHLHFSVSCNGKYVDPAEFLS